MNTPLCPCLLRVVLLAGVLASLVRGATPATTTPVEGLRDASARVHALTGARVVTAPGQVIERGTIVVRDGVIEAVGSEIKAPADARVWDMAGRTIYAGFIESDSTLFLPAGWKSGAAARREDDEASPQPTAGAATAASAEVPAGAKAWNPRVTPERRASRALAADARGADAMRKLGFTVVHTVPARGSFRGQTAAVSLGRGGFNRTLLRDNVAQPLAFERGGRRSGEGAAPSESDASYPTSLMGAVALARQTLLDAQWYADAQRRYRERGTAKIDRPEANDALAALGPVVRGEQPVIIPLEDELDTQRAVRLADEFKLKLVLRASGYDYRSLKALPATRVPMIVPLAFPEPPDVEHADRALDISLDKLQHWELAPANPARLAEAGVPIALTTAGLRRPETEFWSRTRTAVQRGLPADKALGALTTVPAEMIGLAASHGTIAAGKTANLVVTSGDLFASEDSEILVVWVDGEPFEMDGWRRVDIRGTWKFAWEGAQTAPAEIKITGRGATRLRATAGGTEATVRSEGESFAVLAPAKWFGGSEGMARLAFHVEGGALRGSGDLPDGTAVRLRAERTAPAESTRTSAERKPGATIAKGDVFPAGAYGRTALPAQPDALLVKNATIWTSGPEGTLEVADLLVERGKITKVGKALSAPSGATVIDATGRHISPGIIDCHSHMAISGSVNESSHSVTVEVRIGDALDATDIGLYRALAGGLTSANILHGSANSMGGQNQVIKLRWGEQSDGLKFAGAPPGVKFALGENVTRKNSTTGSTRYPVSRMGVREIMLDTFTRARDYEREWTEFKAGRSPLPPRRDLRLEAALEILRGERLIHIHSYRQDEVLAFIRLAQQLKLPVATFQHILEGYKVADEIAGLGAGASSFSDWWAYKHEVVDAIPYNGALLHAAGVVVSFNSDDDELTRHLNTEAAKAVKYGAVSPAEALKFVTLNPAKQLRIDSRVGSLQAGKDADFVIWNAAPLSAYARVEQTWIDGRRYFDRDEDLKMRAAAATERVALIQKILPERQRVIAGGGGGGGGGDGGADAPARPTILQILDQLGTGLGEDRSLYHDGGSVHNCSTCEGGVR